MMKYSPTEELASHYRQTVSGLIMPTNETGWDTKIGETSGLLNE